MSRQHHLIDPATGAPADVRWECVTVCAATCLAADVAAKTAFLLGDDGPDVARAAWAAGPISSRTTTSSSPAAGRETARLRSASSRLDDDLVRRAGRRRRRLPARLGLRARRHPPGRQAARPRPASLRGRGRAPIPRASLPECSSPFTSARSRSTPSCRSRSPSWSSRSPRATARSRPGLGIVALELLLAVSVTNRLRSRLPYRVWRRAHYATLAVWLLATVHGILSGTDRDQTWLLWLYARDRRGRRRRRGAALRTCTRGESGSAPAWRRRAARSLPCSGSQQCRSRLRARERGGDAPTCAIPELSGDLTGTIDRQRLGDRLDQRHSVGPATFRIDLLTGDGRVTDSALQLRFADGTLCEGTLTALDDVRLLGHLRASPAATAARCTPTGRSPMRTVTGSISTSRPRPRPPDRRRLTLSRYASIRSERWQSGRMRRSRKPLSVLTADRGFKSLPLR